MPQALRSIIPPLTNQYLNLTKNSSLSVAIAYPDLVLVFAGTAMMQTGRAIEIVFITNSEQYIFQSNYVHRCKLVWQIHLNAQFISKLPINGENPRWRPFYA